MMINFTGQLSETVFKPEGPVRLCTKRYRGTSFAQRHAGARTEYGSTVMIYKQICQARMRFARVS